jgi:uncharacterized protein YqhQ
MILRTIKHIRYGTFKNLERFILYIWLIGFMPDVKRVFQYHGAEHKSIATFEAGLPLTVENARKFVIEKIFDTEYVDNKIVESTLKYLSVSRQ